METMKTIESMKKMETNKNENAEVFLGLKLKIKDLIENINETNFKKTKSILKSSFLEKRNENKIFIELVTYCSSSFNNSELFKINFKNYFLQSIPLFHIKKILYPIQPLNLSHKNRLNYMDISTKSEFNNLKEEIDWIPTEINIIIKEIDV